MLGLGTLIPLPFSREMHGQFRADHLVPIDEQKANTWALNWAGASRLLTCPAPETTASLAAGIASRIWYAMLIGDRLSASPQTSRVGTLIFGRRSRVSAC